MPPSTATYVTFSLRLLDRSDAVERDAGLADERAAGLEDDARLRELVERPRVLEAIEQRADERLHRQLRGPPRCSECRARRRDRRRTASSRARCGSRRRRRRASRSPSVPRRRRAAASRCGRGAPRPSRPSSAQRASVAVACSGVSPNFEPRWPVCDRPVRVGVDAGRHAHEHPADAGRGRSLGVVGRVEDDEAAGLRRLQRSSSSDLLFPSSTICARRRFPRRWRTRARRASMLRRRGPPPRTARSTATLGNALTL